MEKIEPTPLKCLLGRFHWVMICKRFYFSNLLFLISLSLPTKANDCHNHLKLKTNALFYYFCLFRRFLYEKVRYDTLMTTISYFAKSKNRVN